MDALRSSPIRGSSSAIACVGCLATFSAVADVTEVLAASAFSFVGTVDLVDEGRFVDPLAELVTLCLAEIADPWVDALLVPSAAFVCGLRSNVGLEVAAGAVEATLSCKLRFFLFAPGSNHSSVVDLTVQ